tara:strand:- start:2170 stop:2838 length:669 start_codon:yes stop_codon:yes gene_type:complete
MEEFNKVLIKEFMIAKRSGYETLMPIMYLLIIILFFNISISYVSKNLILELTPLMIWLSCLLVSVLNLESIFKEDYEDGTLDYFISSNSFHESVVIAKIFSHWILTTLPVVVISPIVSLLLGIDYQTTLILFLSLMIGTPTMSLLGSVAAALTLTLKRGKILLAIIVLPMYVPILIFGTSAVNNSFLQMNFLSELIFLCIIFLLFLLISPTACLKSLRLSLD